jgi:hypothetical protein
MKPLCVILVLSLGCLAQEGKPVQTAPTCVATSFSGYVKRGLPFIQTIGSGLTYQLIPAQIEESDSTHPPRFFGWTVRVAYLKNRGEMERDFTFVMTPTHQGRKARDLGKSGTDLSSDHTVYFPLSMFDYSAAEKLAHKISANTASSSTQTAEQELQKISVGSAIWAVVGVPGRFASSVPGRPDLTEVGILDVNFKVDLIVPSSLTLAPELSIKAKPSPCPVLPNSIVE